MVPTLRERFDLFHAANPHIYALLLEMALKAVSAGRKRIGIQTLIEVLRYKHAVQTTGDDFKLPNEYAAFYARMLMQNDTNLAGLFELRHRNTP